MILKINYIKTNTKEYNYPILSFLLVSYTAVPIKRNQTEKNNESFPLIKVVTKS